MAGRFPLRLLGVAPGTLLVAGLLVACTGSDPEPEAAPSAPSTPLASYDTAGLVVARAPFCDRIAEEAVTAVLGGEQAASSSYENGESARIGDRRDVAHEHGCAYRAEDGTTARAWVFAPPVTPARARGLARAAESERGCRPAAEAPAFGRPSAALVCRDGDDSTASFRGLFGDAWLTCTVTASSAAGDPEGVEDQLDRAGRWCVAVVEAAAG
jgi:hypothetical protein